MSLRKFEGEELSYEAIYNAGAGGYVGYSCGDCKSIDFLFKQECDPDATAANWSTYAAQIRAIEEEPDICGTE